MRLKAFVEQLSRNTWQNPLVFLAVWSPVLTVLILTFNPALTADLSLSSRSLFWLMHVTILLPLLMFMQEAVNKRFAALNVHWGVLVVLTSGLAALVFAPIGLVLDWIFSPAVNVGTDPFAIVSILGEEIAALIVPVLCIWILVNITRFSVLSVPVIDAGHERVEDLAELTASECAFWSKVPRTIGFDVVSLSAEQHYLHVRTSVGRSLILFPISKAIQALERLDGIQTHRSHWVRLNQIDELQRDGANMVCVLRNGERLPVSRNRQTQVSQAVQMANLASATHALRGQS